MLNIFKTKKKFFNDKSLSTHYKNKEQNVKIQNKLNKNEYKNIIFYPSSTKEWFNSVYRYNKSYVKSLITTDVILNNLFISYFNMLQDKIKIFFKRRNHNKNRYSANKIYVSRAEIKHTNIKIIIILYTYNKLKSFVERDLRKQVKLTTIKEYLVENEIMYKKTHRNRLTHTLKKNFFIFKKWTIAFLEKNNNLLKCIVSNFKGHLKLYKIPMYDIIWLKNLFRLQQIIFNDAKLINFNKSKFNNLVLNWRNLGLRDLIKKIYDNNVEIKLVELKSIHLNSDVFSSAVVSKLRDRQNKAVRILRKAILQMVKIPDLHTLITFDDRIENMNKENILNVIKQQVVSGVRFEASGRLTRRLTALRAIFKYRYVGGLKDVRSSLNNKSSTILRGFVKSNTQYTLIMSKTRNGSFGLKGWVSSH